LIRWDGGGGDRTKSDAETRKLLILLNEKNAKDTEFTQVRYTAGTRSWSIIISRGADRGPPAKPLAGPRIALEGHCGKRLWAEGVRLGKMLDQRLGFISTVGEEVETMATGSQAYSALEILRNDIGDVLDAPYDREKLFKAFLEGLQISGIKAGDFERVIVGGHFPPGSSYHGGPVFAGTAELYATLSSTQKDELREAECPLGPASPAQISHNHGSGDSTAHRCGAGHCGQAQRVISRFLYLD
jgi:hypothetical protein